MRSLKSSIEANCLGPDATSQLRAIVDRSDGVVLKARNNTVKMALQAPDLKIFDSPRSLTPMTIHLTGFWMVQTT